jgi:membrane protease YdiL (CAAX protease family)
MFAIAVFSALAGPRHKLGQVEWDIPWLLTFPIRTKAVYFAKLITLTCTSFTILILMTTVLSVIYWCRGFGLHSFWIAAYFSLIASLCISGIKTLIETFLMKFFKPGRLRNIQAVLTVISVSLMLGLFSVILTYNAAPVIRTAEKLPSEILYIPTSWPLLICLDQYPAAAVIGGGLIGAAVFSILCVQAASWLIRKGAVTEGGPYTSRRTAKKSGSRRMLFRGVLGKDIRLLFQDRTFLVQTIIMPLLFFCYMALIHLDTLPKLANQNFNVIGSIAFGLGAYALLTGSIHVLRIEQNSLWLIFTFPHRIDRIFIKKALLWTAISLLYPLIFLLIMIPKLGFDLMAIPVLIFVVCGLITYSFIGAGLGILGTNVMEQDPAKRIHASYIYLFMLLAAGYGGALLIDSTWNHFVHLVFAATLAVAIWQKISDSIRYILDPTEKPVPRLGIATGIFAVFGFFIIQSLVYLIGSAAEPHFRGIVGILISYIISGCTVVAFTSYHFWRKKVTNVLALTGIRAHGKVLSVESSLKIGFAAGLITGGIGVLYIFILKNIRFLNYYLEKAYNTNRFDDFESVAGILLLAVLAAPLFEEYIFRGLLFRSVQRSYPLRIAILSSAVLFAAVHPIISFIPVFILGISTAVVFNISGRLITPIVAHMVYNAIAISYTLNW